jgi:hypothetical protein
LASKTLAELASLGHLSAAPGPVTMVQVYVRVIVELCACAIDPIPMANRATAKPKQNFLMGCDLLD